jgi:mitogen-activated protein kinase kinase
MLLQHPWLAPLIKPETITEEDEDEVIAAEEAQADAAAGDVGSPEPSDDVVDKEVADWVKDAIDKRKRGVLGKGVPKPALHAAPLDAVPSPSQSDVNGLDAGAPEAAAAASEEAAA